MRKSPAIGVAALCAVLLSGCQSSGGGTPSEPEISASPATKTVAGVRVPVLPLDAYAVDAQQQEVLDRAVDELAETCMKAKGYTWPARLKQLGVPTELFMYPGDTHGIPDPRNRMVKAVAEMAWMDYYVRGRGNKFSWRDVLKTLEKPAPVRVTSDN